MFYIPDNYIIDFIKKKFKSYPEKIYPLNANASNRIYYRFFINNKSYILTINNNIEENKSFFYVQNFLKKNSINVPDIYFISKNKKIYIQQDLGNTTLCQYCNKFANKPEEILNIYKKVVLDLIKIQNLPLIKFNSNKFFQVKSFNKKTIFFDLNYFKYFFLKLFQIPFNEIKLEKDFNKLTSLLIKPRKNFFVYRDFQSRNIILFEDKLYYIDFQGARRGSLYYDIASLLYDSKVNLNYNLKIKLLKYYYENNNLINNDFDEFLQYFFIYSLFRKLQSFGTYGFRGKFENKIYFLQSIPTAIKNVNEILNNIQCNLPEIKSIFSYLHNNIENFCHKNECNNLSLNIISFSYKEGIPKDNNGHGGGYVFDCRLLPNPAKIPELSIYDGTSLIIHSFFSYFPEVSDFINQACKIVSKSIENYITRNFNSLTVCFGCTGGIHRSVYCAEKFAEIIKKIYPIKISINHTKLGIIKEL